MAAGWETPTVKYHFKLHHRVNQTCVSVVHEEVDLKKWFQVRAPVNMVEVRLDNFEPA